MNRRYEFDWLRAVGAVLVVVADCTMLFSPWVPPFGNIQKNKLFSEIGWNLNLWLMPLFMVLAGGSAWFALRKRSNGLYLRERLTHLGLQLLVLMVTFAVPAGYFIETWTGTFRGSLVDFYLHFFEGHFTFLHLWFLAYLLAYSLLTLPLFRFLHSDTGRWLIGVLAHACQRTGGLFLFALPLLAVRL